MKALYRFLILAVVAGIVCYVLPRTHINNLFNSTLVIAFISAINLLIRPFLKLLALPANALTQGLLLLFVNGYLLLVAGKWVNGFDVETTMCAVFFSIIVSPFSYFLDLKLR